MTCIDSHTCGYNVPQRTFVRIPPEHPAGSRGKEAAVADSYNGYCVKCREKRDFTGEIAESNGRRMAKGTCPVCGTKMTRILGKA